MVRVTGVAHPKRRPSIRTRLAAIAAVAVAVTALLVCTLAWLTLRQTLVQQADNQLRAMAQGPISQLDPAMVASIPSSPLVGPDGIRVQIILSDGHAVGAPQGTELMPVTPIDRVVAARKLIQARYTLDTTHGRFRILTVAGAAGNTIQLARPLADAESTLNRVGIVMILIVLGAALIAALAGRLVASAGLRPVARLTRAATRVADTQDLSQAIPIDGHDEVAQLGSAFNRMLSALNQSRRAQQDLVEDAAHELRTPMSSVRTNIDLLIHAGQRLPDTDRQALLRDLDRQATELSDLVADVVNLARFAGTDEAPEPVDLADVVADAVVRASARTPLGRFQSYTEPVIVHGQHATLERAVVNLLDNAVKFGPADQTVEVRVGPRVGRGGGYAEVSVADRAPSIPEAERERIFHRFHRLDSARAVPGSGLGLAIVHQAATAHHGSASVEPRPGGGNIFRLRLPLHPDSGAAT